MESGAVLSGVDIARALVVGDIRIEPFVEKNLTNVAYDITIGDTYFIDRSENLHSIDATSKSEISESWQSCSPSNGMITIPARSSIIAHSHEFIGSMPGTKITTMLRARSTLAARLGLSISASGGWGDIGFNSRWSMFITNHRNCPVTIPVGTRVAQIVFFRTSSTDASYSEKSGTYANASESQHRTFEELAAEWTLADILPPC